MIALRALRCSMLAAPHASFAGGKKTWIDAQLPTNVCAKLPMARMSAIGKICATCCCCRIYAITANRVEARQTGAETARTKTAAPWKWRGSGKCVGRSLERVGREHGAWPAQVLLQLGPGKTGTRVLLAAGRYVFVAGHLADGVVRANLLAQLGQAGVLRSAE